MPVGVDRRFQFTTKNALIATFWVAVWLACATANIEWSEIGPAWLMDWWLMDTFQFGVLVIPLPAAFGAICGRPLFGFLCGVVGYFGLWLGAWISFELNPPVPF